METKILNQEWKEVWKIQLNDWVFNLDVNSWLIHRYLVYQLANARQVVAHTKTRWEVAWSTRKIYKQKWTWRARMWANRSPVRIWGWVVFGPRNNANFSLWMNKKERKLALCHILSLKAKNNNLIVLDNIEFSETKTKNMVWVLKVIPYEKNILLALNEKNSILEKSANNIPVVKTINLDYLNASDLLKYKTLVLLKDWVEKLNSLK